MPEKLDRRGRLLTLLGALIVFLTFVVKDAIREQVKDTVDALQAADYQFVSTSENALNLSFATEILRTANAIFHRLTAAPSDSLEDSLEDIQPNILQDIATLENLKRLIEKLPGEESSLRNSLQELEGRRRALVAGSDNLEKQAKSNKHPTEDEDDSMHDQLDSIGTESEDLLSDIGKLNGQALDRLTEIRRSEEQKYHRYTLMSYLLYAIGWSLALFGRLYRVDSITEEG